MSKKYIVCLHCAKYFNVSCSNPEEIRNLFKVMVHFLTAASYSRKTRDAFDTLDTLESEEGSWQTRLNIT